LRPSDKLPVSSVDSRAQLCDPVLSANMNNSINTLYTVLPVPIFHKILHLNKGKYSASLQTRKMRKSKKPSPNALLYILPLRSKTAANHAMKT
jgi:hypothetical protein